jgi:hypothetical protein
MPLSDYIRLEKCSAKDSLRIIQWLTATSVIVFVLIAYSPVEMLFDYFSFENTNGCTLYTFFGFPCPACGLGRSLKDFAVLDFTNMFYYNPSAVLIYLIVFITITAVFFLALFRYKFKLMPKLLKLWYIPVLLLIIIWVLNVLYGHHD